MTPASLLSSSLTPRAVAASWTTPSVRHRFVALLVTPFVVDFEMSHVVLDESEVADDLAQAFSRGPFSSLSNTVALPSGQLETLS